MQSKLKPALIGGVLLGTTSAIPFLNLLNCACCAWVILGGLAASYLYWKDAPRIPSPWGDSILLGLATGGIGAVVTTLVGIPLRMMMGGAAGIGAAMDQLRSRLGDQDLPPQVAEMLGSMSGSAAVGCVGTAIAFVMSLVVFSIFATVGSLIGTALFAKK